MSVADGSTPLLACPPGGEPDSACVPVPTRTRLGRVVQSQARPQPGPMGVSPEPRPLVAGGGAHSSLALPSGAFAPASLGPLAHVAAVARTWVSALKIQQGLLRAWRRPMSGEVGLASQQSQSGVRGLDERRSQQPERMTGASGRGCAQGAGVFVFLSPGAAWVRLRWRRASPVAPCGMDWKNQYSENEYTTQSNL